MSYIKFDNNKINNKKAEELIELCPFNAIEFNDNHNLTTNSACKLCKLCIKKSNDDCVEFIEDTYKPQLNKEEWRGIAVFVEHTGNKINPVVFELLSKASELAKKIDHPVYALWIGDNNDGIEQLIKREVEVIYSYTAPELADFRILPYADVFEDFVNNVKPCVCLIGATNLGRSLGPRIAARMRTGMTADCTMLDIRQNTDLVQIRPAFGGNIMAKILCPNTRPQFCSVREKVFKESNQLSKNNAQIIQMQIPNLHIKNKVKSIQIKKVGESITDADVIVAIGRGLKNPADIEIFEHLANLLNAKLACSRALSEIGWMPADKQIGLSGKNITPKLLITFGISGAVQFIAGVSGCENIISVNSDADAPIFNVANVKVVDDMYEIANNMIELIEHTRG